MRCKYCWLAAVVLASLILTTLAGASSTSAAPDPFADALRDDLNPDQTIHDARQTLYQIGDHFDSGDFDRLTPAAFSAMGVVALEWSRIGWAKFLQKQTLDSIQFLTSAWLLSQSGVVADRLGRVYEKEGQKETARHFYALAAARGGPDAQSARDQVTRLSTTPDAAAQEISKASSEVLEMRTVKLPAPSGNGGSAEFALVFDASSKPSRAEFLDGDDALRSVADKIRDQQFMVRFPDDSSIKIVRHALLTCAQPGCSLILQPVESPSNSSAESLLGPPAPDAAKSAAPAPPTSSAPMPTLSRPGDQPAPAPSLPANAPLIDRAREAAFQFSQKLPNFRCQEFMSRFKQEGQQKSPLDLVSAEIIYEDGQETYRDVKIDNHPADKALEQIGGSWSTGEFASMLLELFHPQTRAQFRSGGSSPISGVSAQVYDFQVQAENSHWMLEADSQKLASAYQGSVWIDPSTARVLRIEIQARNLPSDFPMSAVETAIDYSFVRIGEKSFLLPVHAESLGCQRNSSYCSHNIIDFRNYHEFKSDIKIIPD
ncbi:MAG TPA: hypothetical protein VF753_22305 [Terriglobales bacterium]